MFPGFLSALASVQGPAIPGALEEPILDVQEIQGSILVGFNKDYQHFIFFQITKPAVTKSWLRLLTPLIATLDETLAFRRLFRALRVRRPQNRQE